MALPPISGQPAPRIPPAGDARTAAQRAFFEAALGRGQIAEPATRPTATAATPAVRAASPAPSTREEPSATQRPDGNARPGSIVNIRV